MFAQDRSPVAGRWASRHYGSVDDFDDQNVCPPASRYSILPNRHPQMEFVAAQMGRCHSSQCVGRRSLGLALARHVPFHRRLGASVCHLCRDRCGRPISASDILLQSVAITSLDTQTA